MMLRFSPSCTSFRMKYSFESLFTLILRMKFSVDLPTNNLSIKEQSVHRLRLLALTISSGTSNGKPNAGSSSKFHYNLTISSSYIDSFNFSFGNETSFAEFGEVKVASSELTFRCSVVGSLSNL